MIQDRTVARRKLLQLGLAGSAGLVAMAIAGCGDDDGAPAATSTPANGSDAAKALSLVSGWYRGRQVRYYDFGGGGAKLTQGSSIAVAPIFAFIRGIKADGSPDLFAGQNNVIDVKPGDAGYSDLWQVALVTVPSDYKANAARSRADITASGYPLTVTQMFVNCPVVAEATRLEGGEKLVQGWYKGQPVFYPDFGANAPVAIPIWVFITGMDSRGMPQFVSGQSNIIDAVPMDAGYSAFWRVNLVTVPSGYSANSIKSADAVRSSSYKVTETDMVVNCPVVSVA